VDGSCVPNPGGTACVGVVMKKDGVRINEISKVIGKGTGMTTNTAEYHAVICSLNEVKNLNLQDNEIIVNSDSQLMVYQINGIYRLKDSGLLPLFRAVKDLLVKTGAKLVWIPREENAEADKLATMAQRSAQKSNFG
jgi:ribonuclease HI